MITQEQINSSSVSNILTYTSIFDKIRNLYAETNFAKENNLKKQLFSFNQKGGRCEHCKGKGYITISMDFLPDITQKCEFCNGNRFNKNILECKLNNKNINDILNLSISDLHDFIINIDNTEPITNQLEVLINIGLGYIIAGQPTNTLSGGELQRLKLANKLCNNNLSNNLYLLDEPTTGLHFKDIETLLQLFKNILSKKNTIICVEHNEKIINNAQNIIKLGPEGGEKGGYLIN